MARFELPYGHTTLSCEIPNRFEAVWITPPPQPGVADPAVAISAALNDLKGGAQWADFAGAKSAAIAINDKTRPVPHRELLPPVLDRLERLGLRPDQITFIIATGAHTPMTPEEHARILPQALIERYPIISHDADDYENLIFLGATSAKTPVWINRRFMEAELRIVVGNIEPHQFMGFSGGYKSAAIGLAGRKTINKNHAMMAEPQAKLGHFADNPARQDVEEIGRMIGVHLAINTILNENLEILYVVAGAPKAVTAVGVPLASSVCELPVPTLFDVLIASPGGYPKDINLYQAQKGLAHAALITRAKGTVILVAACSEGTGSHAYEGWVEQSRTHEEVIKRFAQEEFRVGPHKALQIAQDARRVDLLLVSQMAPARVRRLLLTPAESLQDAVDLALSGVPPSVRIGVMPKANVTIPRLRVEAQAGG